MIQLPVCLKEYLVMKTNMIFIYISSLRQKLCLWLATCVSCLYKMIHVPCVTGDLWLSSFNFEFQIWNVYSGYGKYFNLIYCGIFSDSSQIHVNQVSFESFWFISVKIFKWKYFYHIECEPSWYIYSILCDTNGQC